MTQPGQYTTDTEIDGVKISTTLFGPLEIYRLTPRIVRLFVPVLQLQDSFRKIAPILMKALNGKDGIDQTDAMKAMTLVDAREFEPVIATMMDGLGREENVRLPMELMCRTTLMERNSEGAMTLKQLTSAADIDDAFRGRPLLMLRVMWFSVVVNFGSFFRGGRPSAPTSNSAT